MSLQVLTYDIRYIIHRCSVDNRWASSITYVSWIRKGPFRESNPGPPPPKGGIIPLDQTDVNCITYLLKKFCQYRLRYYSKLRICTKKLSRTGFEPVTDGCLSTWLLLQSTALPAELSRDICFILWYLRTIIITIWYFEQKRRHKIWKLRIYVPKYK